MSQYKPRRLGRWHPKNDETRMQKTKKSAAKRWRIMGGGKLKSTTQAGKRHIASTKNRQKKLSKMGTRYLKDANLKNMKLLMPHAKGIWNVKRTKVRQAPKYNLVACGVLPPSALSTIPAPALSSFTFSAAGRGATTVTVNAVKKQGI